MNNWSYLLNAGRIRLEFSCVRMTNCLFFCDASWRSVLLYWTGKVITAEISGLNLSKIKFLVQGSAMLSGSIRWPFNVILIPFTRYNLVTVMSLVNYYTSNCPEMRSSSHDIFLKPALICSSTKTSYFRSKA